MTEQQIRFWVVWNPKGRNPQIKHYSRANADDEAKRLARDNPKQTFYVLKCMAGFQSQDRPVDKITMFTDQNQIPF